MNRDIKDFIYELKTRQSILNNDLAYSKTLFKGKKINKYIFYKIKNIIDGKQNLLKILLMKLEKGGK